MEGAIKLLKFCMEQKQAGNNIFYDYSPHVDKVAIWGYIGEWHECKEPDLKVCEWDYWNGSKMSEERADEIINEIKEKLK